jgi:hypothetical protein
MNPFKTTWWNCQRCLDFQVTDINAPHVICTKCDKYNLVNKIDLFEHLERFKEQDLGVWIIHPIENPITDKNIAFAYSCNSAIYHYDLCNPKDRLDGVIDIKFDNEKYIIYFYCLDSSNKTHIKNIGKKIRNIYDYSPEFTYKHYSGKNMYRSKNKIYKCKDGVTRGRKNI